MKGFSYAEFLIVITLTIITALGTVFTLTKFVAGQAPQQAARAIRALLRDAAQRSMTQEEGMYWGVRFENLSSRDRYILFKSSTAVAATYTTSTVAYLSPAVQFEDPATAKNIVFDKMTGAMVSASCPSETASSTITMNAVSVRVYCNGKIE